MMGKKTPPPPPPPTPDDAHGYADAHDEDAPEPIEHDLGETDEFSQLMLERDEMEAKWKRAIADFQNYQRRAAESEREARKQGTTSTLMAILPVIDHFDLALDQDPETVSVEQLIEGVRTIRDEFIRVIESRGVTLIAPKPGDEFNPGNHEALTQQPAEGVDPGCISALFQVGYMLDARVIRPAKVAVAPTEEG